MLYLPESAIAWGSPGFREVLKRELEQRGAGQLPLQQGLLASSYALDEAIEVMIISVTDEPGLIHAKAGVFYSGITAGCSCPDDPTPVTPQSEYCELRLTIDKTTGLATVRPSED
ncbi:MAG: hypothetical protein IPL03_00725 [Sterolibacteriaceae bacterium]|nr:hypothetical protein [Candidatus Methylophosphatis haderslevensis]